MSCTFFGCSLGNGRLKIITRDISEARAATNPNEWAERLEKQKIQQNILAEKEKAEASKEAKRLKEREDYEKKVKDYNPKSRKPFQTVGGTPAQVKAALMYNDLLIQWKLCLE